MDIVRDFTIIGVEPCGEYGAKAKVCISKDLDNIHFAELTMSRDKIKLVDEVEPSNSFNIRIKLEDIVRDKKYATPWHATEDVFNFVLKKKGFKRRVFDFITMIDLLYPEVAEARSKRHHSNSKDKYSYKNLSKTNEEYAKVLTDAITDDE